MEDQKAIEQTSEENIEIRDKEGGVKKLLDVSKVSGKKRAVLVVVFLLVINILIIREYFNTAFSYVFSAPIVPVLANLLTLFGLDIDMAVRTVLLLFYVLGSLTLYQFAQVVAGRRKTAFLAAVLYSLPIFGSRFQALTALGDGAYVAALTLMPLAAGFLLKFLKDGSFGAAILSSLMMLLVAMTSPFGLFVLTAVMLVVTFSEMLLGSGRLKFIRFVWTLLIAAGFSAFWYNPEFVQVNLASQSGRVVVEGIKNLIPISLFAVPVFGSFGYLIFDRRPHLQPLFIALGLTVVFGMISFAGGLARFAVSAQSRYYPVLSMSIALLWGVVGIFIYDMVNYLPRSKWFPIPKSKREKIRQILVVLFFVVTIGLVVGLPFRGNQGRRRQREESESVNASSFDLGGMRGSTGAASEVLGYVISGVTAVGVAGVYFRIGKLKKVV